MRRRNGSSRRSTPASACWPSCSSASGLSRLKPAAPTVERAVVWPDKVKRGPMVRQVRGLGTLTPEDIRWIPATTQGRVEQIILRPGTAGEGGRRDPRAEQPAARAAAAGRAAEAAGAPKRGWPTSGCSCRTTCSQQRAASASIEADYNKAKMQAQMNEALAKDQLVSELVLKQSQVDAESARRAQPDREGSARRARPTRRARRSPCSSRWSIRRARSSA